MVKLKTEGNGKYKLYNSETHTNKQIGKKCNDINQNRFLTFLSLGFLKFLNKK